MIIPSPADLAGRYRVTNGSRFRLKDIDPADPWGKRLKPIAGEMLKQGCKRMAEPAGAPLRAGSLVGAADLPGDGRRRQGQHHQARHVAASTRRAARCTRSRRRRPRSSITISCGAPTARLPRRGHIGIFNRSYYEETLVVRVHQNILAQAAAADRAGDQEHLARALRGHQRLRALPVAAGRAGPQVLPARLEGGAAPALPRAARRSRRSTGSSRPPTSASARTSRLT